MSKGPPISGEVPDMRVDVDLTPPVVKIYEPLPDPNQKDTMILRWQAELFGITTFELPAVRKLTEAATQVSTSVERITAVAEKLPERVTKEREELVKALEAQEKTLSPMVKEVHQTVEAGSAMIREEGRSGKRRK